MNQAISALLYGDPESSAIAQTNYSDFDLASSELLERSYLQSAVYQENYADPHCRDIMQLATLLRFCLKRDAWCAFKRKMFTDPYEITEREEELLKAPISEETVLTPKTFIPHLCTGG